MNSSERIATKIVRTLREHGFVAYFAGGWVRDHLLGLKTDEVDIATSASPEKVQSIFPKTYAVGISFGVIVIVAEGHQFEVTTFRKDLDYTDGRHPSGVDFSTPEKDASRRDFTINGMFYDPLTQEIHDYVGGQEDLKKRIIRAIGQATLRFQEDRLRMIRAIRFSARFGFEIEKETFKAIEENAPSLLPAVSMERIWQEWTKMCNQPHLDKAILLLQETGLLKVLFPGIENVSEQVQLFPYFPLQTPPVVYLLELFPHTGLERRLELCKYLKTSTEERRLAEFFQKSEPLLKSNPSKVDWTVFYAHPSSSLFLEVEGAKLLPPKREEFHEEHQRRKKELMPHIQRVIDKRPLVNAMLLQKEGILPGKQMGLLLKEAEKITIEENHTDPALVISHLKNSIFWS
jgi:poly(A) polymerase